MGDRSMTDCLTEQLEFARNALSGSDMTTQDFYDSGQDYEAISDKIDDVARESLAHAWGYLEGAADALDLTVLEMLESHGLMLEAPSAPSADIVYRCKCSWIGGDPDIGPGRGTKDPTCPACWHHDRRRVKVYDRNPPCLVSMGCLCAGHARNAAPDRPCDTREENQSAKKRQRIRKVAP